MDGCSILKKVIRHRLNWVMRLEGAGLSSACEQHSELPADIIARCFSDSADQKASPPFIGQLNARITDNPRDEHASTHPIQYKFNLLLNKKLQNRRSFCI